ncbi:hypothetical protein [Rhodococcus opacus]|uniref:hypothetical protein n=1 Tax=Rhodococcus opacus TaxID=37919 RepID=UPI00374F0FEE
MNQHTQEADPAVQEMEEAVAATSGHTRSTHLPAKLIATLALLAAVAPLAIMYLPAFPAMATEFDTSASAVQLTLTTFLIGLAAGQLVFGPLSGRAPRRPARVAGAQQLRTPGRSGGGADRDPSSAVPASAHSGNKSGTVEHRRGSRPAAATPNASRPRPPGLDAHAPKI